MEPVPSIYSPTNNTKSNGHSTSSVHALFIISLTDNGTNNNLTHQTANELMEELKEALKNSKDQINLKLMSSKVDPVSDRISTVNEMRPNCED
ncbi:unnamed protein product [Rotaria sp. Silwood2]|nr:unnamed protein product [Rotaria sp. Silwood2]CAF4813643.1 unnamed protein product [Rotaria sp. Silwood2]